MPAQGQLSINFLADPDSIVGPLKAHGEEPRDIAGPSWGLRKLSNYLDLRGVTYGELLKRSLDSSPPSR